MTGCWKCVGVADGGEGAAGDLVHVGDVDGAHVAQADDADADLIHGVLFLALLAWVTSGTLSG